MVANNAGQPATPADLINVDEVIGKYYDLVPDPEVPEQRVIFLSLIHISEPTRPY